ncbi:hypothetical protein U1Q18_045571 [Sarracenia purpurea var. burkii]
MDGGFAEHYVAFNGEEGEEEGQEQGQEYDEEQTQQHLSSDRGIESFGNLDDSAGNHHRRHDSTSGKLFVGGVAWETTEETFTNYFCKYGEITDSVIMMDKLSGRSRGFGFVTFADPAVADKVLEEEHVIDGRAVEVKRTVPREEMHLHGVEKTKKIFVGGIPPSLNEEGLKEYFSSYGRVADHQIMIDRNTGRSRGFGFVTFENEDAVERIFSEGRTHELGGKQVEIKKAVPKSAGGDYTSDSRMRHGGSALKPYGGFSRGTTGYGGGYNGKMGRGYGTYGGYDTGFGNYGGNYGGAASGFYGGYGGYGYGFGFWGPTMYGGSGGGYGSSGYGSPAGYGDGKGYNSGGAGKGYGRGGGGFGGNKGYGNGGAGAASGRFHPYRK